MPLAAEILEVALLAMGGLMSGAAALVSALAGLVVAFRAGEVKERQVGVVAEAERRDERREVREDQERRDERQGGGVI